MQRKSSDSVRIFYPRFDKRGLIEAIDKGLRSLRKELPATLVVLFGSYATGNYTVGSDVDLLVVYRGRERKDAYAGEKKRLIYWVLSPMFTRKHTTTR